MDGEDESHEAGLALGLDLDAIIDHVRAYGADTTAKDNS